MVFGGTHVTTKIKLKQALLIVRRERVKSQRN